mmetsp:Transcript_19584/g.34610  ORF Transcript_19584/g.34610 Transcript_19584/m.34610 type:complete len:212 (-) Transcript_19584:100-735(-)|eukprot:CAMPEP_0197665060 /NCGR_PEP_ID=MMETSP1338-20131121/59011_1 /TAXON_ID=43686 ORGANISM="Pelagodinium beii, Strain RCC1491" /NCGR_SAMPLE_ID=MMETSP1338 /ASSEMBLY_ACC=CAM_ASM_000754 /LENGTH=211 /DNA_ID=CAMNT_0043243813 /DNA_START=40 /DNA_END=675 /DNA_ORIENTATION=-
MARFRGAQLRRFCVAAVAFAAFASMQGPLAMMLEDAVTTKHGKSSISQAVLNYLAQQAANGDLMRSNHFDTNAVGEGWRGSPMMHWVDRAGVDESNENLEKELMATRIGGRNGHEGRRFAMHKARLERQRLAEARKEAREERQKNFGRQVLATDLYDTNALGERWQSGSSSAMSAEQEANGLEQELRSMTVARQRSSEGHRLRMQKKRAVA